MSKAQEHSQATLDLHHYSEINAPKYLSKLVVLNGHHFVCHDLRGFCKPFAVLG